MGAMTAQMPLPLSPHGAIPIGDAAAMTLDEFGVTPETVWRWCRDLRT
jgi:hypothetical protein